MQEFDVEQLKKLYIPPPDSHKGQNGKLLIIGGSRLFHAASLWALTVASRIVDMVYYSSVPENNVIVKEAKKEFRDGIVVPREKIEDYVNEADCVLIGPGMLRAGREADSRFKIQELNIKEITALEDEGEHVYWLTKYLLEKYPQKKWVIDAGALQMMEPEWLLQLNGNVIITPHEKEFERVFYEEFKVQSSKFKIAKQKLKVKSQLIHEMAGKYKAIILLKGQEDIVCSPTDGCVRIAGGNAGMTKGGTGDVLAGMVSALACKNDLFLSACAASYINKKAGESLFEKMGFYFNSSDLAAEIPLIMNDLIIKV